MSLVQKTLVITVALLTVLAQAVAAVPTGCTMGHNHHATAAAVDHSVVDDFAHHHHHQTEPADAHAMHESPEPSSGDNCCQPDGACSMASCAAYTAVTSELSTSVLMRLPIEIAFISHPFASVPLASVYKPPISI